MSSQDAQALTRGHIPNAQGIIPAGGQGHPTVGRQRHTAGFACVPTETNLHGICLGRHV
jgi:hypothetical protein